MPLQMLRASRGHAAKHVWDNLWLWIGGAAAVTAILTVLQITSSTRNILGDLGAFAGMILGILVMMQSQVGFVSEHAPPADDDATSDTVKVAPVPSPAPSTSAPNRT